MSELVEMVKNQPLTDLSSFEDRTVCPLSGDQRGIRFLKLSITQRKGISHMILSLFLQNLNNVERLREGFEIRPQNV